MARVYLHVCLLNFEMARLNNTKRCDSREADDVIDFRRWRHYNAVKKDKSIFLHTYCLYTIEKIYYVLYTLHIFIF